jgi:hypothetical protein
VEKETPPVKGGIFLGKAMMRSKFDRNVNEKKRHDSPGAPRLYHLDGLAFSFGTPSNLKNSPEKYARQNISKIINSRFCFLQVQADVFAESDFRKIAAAGFCKAMQGFQPATRAF